MFSFTSGLNIRIKSL